VAPAVQITKSVFPDYVVCLECGKKMTMLKRHLMTEHAMSVEQYRAKYGLPGNYPTVAPNYAATRSNLAKEMGLGKSRTVAVRKASRKSAARRAKS
jgi:predicted transcriptional regulator